MMKSIRRALLAVVQITVLSCALVAQGHLPDALTGDFHEAVEAQKASDLARAQRLLESVLDRGGNVAFVHNNLGIVYHLRADDGHAVAQFQQAIALDPNYAAPRVMLGAILRAHGQLLEARRQLLRAAALDHSQPLTFAELAKVDLGLHDEAAAIEHWSAAAKLDPSNPEYAYQLGAAYLDLSRSCAEQVMKQHPESARAWQFRAQVYSLNGNLEAARKAFAQAIAIDPTLPGNHLGLAELSLKAGDAPAAIAEVDRELAIAPGSSAALELKRRLTAAQ